MINTCKKCGNEINELNFTEEQKLELWGLIAQDLKLFAVKKLVNDFGLSHKEAKIIVDHINNENGKCLRCDFNELDGENIECPKCGAFNYNINEPLFNEAFCTHLEWKLDFENLGVESVKEFWCDGVDHFPPDFKSLSVDNILKNKEILTKAWIGKDGQDIYEMKIVFGDQSIENYKNGLSLIECIPDYESVKWIKIEPESNRIEVNLD